MHKATAYFVIPTVCEQGRFLMQLLREMRDPKGAEIFPIDEGAIAPSETVAFFFCDAPRRMAYGRRFNFFRIGSDLEDFVAVGVNAFPACVGDSAIKVAVRRMTMDELRDPTTRKRLTDAIRQTLKECTTRIRHRSQRKEGRFQRPAMAA